MDIDKVSLNEMGDVRFTTRKLHDKDGERYIRIEDVINDARAAEKTADGIASLIKELERYQSIKAR